MRKCFLRNQLVAEDVEHGHLTLLFIDLHTKQQTSEKNHTPTHPVKKHAWLPMLIGLSQFVINPASKLNYFYFSLLSSR